MSRFSAPLGSGEPAGARFDCNAKNNEGKIALDHVVERFKEPGDVTQPFQHLAHTRSLELVVKSVKVDELGEYEKGPGKEILLNFVLRQTFDSLISVLSRKTLDVDDSYNSSPASLSPLEAACTYTYPLDDFISIANRNLNLSKPNKLILCL